MNEALVHPSYFALRTRPRADLPQWWLAAHQAAHAAPRAIRAILAGRTRVEVTAAEALTNVAKYARATHARVNVRRHSGQVLVEVSDDGVGGADPATGSGLRGLGDRVLSVGGRFEVDSPPGRGTTVRATIPCE